MKKRYKWIGPLWIWWTVCSLSLLGLWAVTTRAGVRALLQERQLEVERWQLQLRTKFTAMEQLPDKLLSHPDGSNQPFYTVYRNNQLPGWIAQLLDRHRGETKVVLRPLPPGLDRSFLPPPSGTPESYYVVAQRLPEGDWLVASLNVDYVHGEWTRNQIRSWPLGPAARWQWRSGVDAWGPGRLARQLPSLLANQEYPFDRLDFEVSDETALHSYLRGQALWLVAGGLVLLSFGWTIHLAARALRREWDGVQARRHFNALVSHELRTPISAIRMYTEILQNGWIDDPEKLRGYHDIIAREGSRLGNLVENLLGVGSLENGQTQFEKAPVDLESLVREMVAREKWPVELDLEPDLPAALGDREALQLVFGNLLQNGLRYADQVSLRASRNQGQLMIEVLDRGPGVPVSMRTRIFEAYLRLPDSSSGGVGLGLALVKGFVEAQGGTVEVTDREGGGACFRVRLKSA